MLVKEYRELTGISLKELKKIWDKVKNKSLIMGGWASHFLSNEKFYDWKGVEYIGSKDIDLGIRAKDVGSISDKLEKIGYSPIKFRFYKIFDRTTKKQLDVKTSEKMPIFEVFYLYVDLILDEKTQTKTTFFAEPLLKFCLENNLWVKKNNFRIVRPEAFVSSKLRILKYRDSEKKIKDILDCVMVLNFSEFDIGLFREISDIFRIDKVSDKLAVETVNSYDIERELLELRLSRDEIQNIKTTFISLLKWQR